MFWRSDSGRLCYPDSYLVQSNQMNPETTAVGRTFVSAVTIDAVSLMNPDTTAILGTFVRAVTPVSIHQPKEYKKYRHPHTMMSYESIQRGHE